MYSFEKLQQMTMDELKAEYNRMAQHTVLGVSFLREEIARREADERNQTMIDLTQQVRNLTVIIAVMTLINLLILLREFF